MELEASKDQLEADSTYLDSTLNATEIEEQLRRVAGKMEMASLEVQHMERLLNEQKTTPTDP